MTLRKGSLHREGVEHAGTTPSAQISESASTTECTAEALGRGSERYDRVLAALRRHQREAPGSAPTLHGTTWFRQSGDEAGWRVLTSGTPDGPWEPVVVASEVDDMSLDFVFPSPRGRYIALGVSRNGSEESTIRVFDVERRRLLPDELDDASFADVSWLPDESGFFVSLGPLSPSHGWQQQLFSHELGAATALVPLEFDEPFVFSEVSPDGRFVVAFDGEDRRLRHLRDSHLATGWTEVDGDTGPLRHGFFVDDSYIALSHLGHDRGRIVSIPLDDPADFARWRELVPETELVLRGLVRAGRFMVLAGLRDGESVVSVKTMDGRHVRDVPLPAPGSVAVAPSILQAPLAPLVSPAGERLTFHFTNYRTPPRPHLYSIESDRLEILAGGECTPEVGLLESRETATAVDGTTVLVSLVSREPIRERPRPTLIYVYGGWNVALTPCWTSEFNTLLDAGVVIAMPSLRGGGEGGDDFWNAGRGRNLQATNDDLYAVAEWLIREGISSAEMLGVVGASNGGLVVCAALTQRPELFGAAVAAVPLTDLVNYMRDPITSSFVTEYGNPDENKSISFLRSFSPLQNIQPRDDYPASLIISSADDIRCPPWHGRNYAKALDMANSGNKPVFFRLWQKSGHREFESGRIDHTAEWITFLLDELRVDTSSSLPT